MAAHFKDLVLDADDHQALADWWCAALGYARRSPPTGRTPPAEWPVAIHDPFGEGPLIWIAPARESKAAGSRMHIDVRGDVDELLALGATVVRRRDSEISWDVLADPEGNAFGVFPPKSPPPPLP